MSVLESDHKAPLHPGSTPAQTQQPANAPSQRPAAKQAPAQDSKNGSNPALQVDSKSPSSPPAQPLTPTNNPSNSKSSTSSNRPVDPSTSSSMVHPKPSHFGPQAPPAAASSSKQHPYFQPHNGASGLSAHKAQSTGNFPPSTSQSFLVNHQYNGSTQFRSTSGTQYEPSTTTKQSSLTKHHHTIDHNHPEHELVYDMMVGMRTRFAALEQLEFQQAARDAKAKRDQGGAEDGRDAHPQKHPKDNTNRSPLQLNILPPPPPYTPQPIDPQEFRTNVQQDFPKNGSSYTPPVQLDEFEFKDYCPKVFRSIRQFFGIHPIEYINSVCGNAEYIEFLSNSKSGEFFCYTNDLRYMIKTIPKAESLFLREILPAYYNHIMDNPHTLLTRFFGMYRVNSARLKKTHFLLMGSVFFTDFRPEVTMTRVYDMKGSTLGRSVTAKEKLRSENPVWKDNDFIEHNHKIVLKPNISKKLRDQIRSDVEFLRDLQVMDYSLLIGVLDLETAEQYTVPLLDANGNIVPVIYIDAQTGAPILDHHDDSKSDELFDENGDLTPQEGYITTDISHRFQVTLGASVDVKDNLSQIMAEKGKNDNTESFPKSQSTTTGTVLTQTRSTTSIGEYGSDPRSIATDPVAVDHHDAVDDDKSPHNAQTPRLAVTTSTTSQPQCNSSHIQNSGSFNSHYQGSTTGTAGAHHPSTPANSTAQAQVIAINRQRKNTNTAHLPRGYTTGGTIRDVKPSFEPFQPIPHTDASGGSPEPHFNRLGSIQPVYVNIEGQPEYPTGHHVLTPLTPQHSATGQPQLATALSRSNSTAENGQTPIAATTQHNAQSTTPLTASPAMLSTSLSPQAGLAQPIVALAPSDVVIPPDAEPWVEDDDTVPERGRARTIVAKEKKDKKVKKVDPPASTTSTRQPTVQNYTYSTQTTTTTTNIELASTNETYVDDGNPYTPPANQQQQQSPAITTATKVTEHQVEAITQLTLNPQSSPDAHRRISLDDIPDRPNSPSYINIPPQSQPNIMSDDPSQPTIRCSIFTQDMGGIRGSGIDRNKIFYLGIIDVLTQYNWRKKGETWLKSLRYDPDQISAVSPNKYAERFLGFMDEYVVAADDDPDGGLIRPELEEELQAKFTRDEIERKELFKMAHPPDHDAGSTPRDEPEVKLNPKELKKIAEEKKKQQKQREAEAKYREDLAKKLEKQKKELEEKEAKRAEEKRKEEKKAEEKRLKEEAKAAAKKK